MNALTIPSEFRDLTIGFDDILNRMHNSHRNSYPPHNILKVNDHEWIIEIAVAGFSKSELEIVLEDRLLTIQSLGPPKDEVKDYIHKGISTKKFKKSFTLANSVEVKDADLVDGLLRIRLEENIPEDKNRK
jgi:molecular chaperone IbpA